MTTRDGTSTLLLYPSGVYFDPMAPDPTKIHVEDVAHALAAIPRFNGHTPEPYSVAQHSVLVSLVMERAGAAVDTAQRWALFGLLHEVAEALSGFGDVCGPVKRVPHVAAVVKPIERAIEAAAARAWGFPEDFASCAVIKRADRYVLDWEDRDLREDGGMVLPSHLGPVDADPGRRSGQEIASGPQLPEEKIRPWPFTEARGRFLARYTQLGGVL